MALLCLMCADRPARRRSPGSSLSITNITRMSAARNVPQRGQAIVGAEGSGTPAGTSSAACLQTMHCVTAIGLPFYPEPADQAKLPNHAACFSKLPLNGEVAVAT